MTSTSWTLASQSRENSTTTSTSNSHSYRHAPQREENGRKSTAYSVVINQPRNLTLTSTPQGTRFNPSYGRVSTPPSTRPSDEKSQYNVVNPPPNTYHKQLRSAKQRNTFSESSSVESSRDFNRQSVPQSQGRGPTAPIAATASRSHQRGPKRPYPEEIVDEAEQNFEKMDNISKTIFHKDDVKIATRSLSSEAFTLGRNFLPAMYDGGADKYMHTSSSSKIHSEIPLVNFERKTKKAKKRPRDSSIASDNKVKEEFEDLYGASPSPRLEAEPKSKNLSHQPMNLTKTLTSNSSKGHPITNFRTEIKLESSTPAISTIPQDIRGRSTPPEWSTERAAKRRKYKAAEPLEEVQRLNQANNGQPPSGPTSTATTKLGPKDAGDKRSAKDRLVDRASPVNSKTVSQPILRGPKKANRKKTDSSSKPNTTEKKPTAAPATQFRSPESWPPILPPKIYNPARPKGGPAPGQPSAVAMAKKGTFVPQTLNDWYRQPRLGPHAMQKANEDLLESSVVKAIQRREDRSANVTGEDWAPDMMDESNDYTSIFCSEHEFDEYGNDIHIPRSPNRQASSIATPFTGDQRPQRNSGGATVEELSTTSPSPEPNGRANEVSREANCGYKLHAYFFKGPPLANLLTTDHAFPLEGGISWVEFKLFQRTLPPRERENIYRYREDLAHVGNCKVHSLQYPKLALSALVLRGHPGFNFHNGRGEPRRRENRRRTARSPSNDLADARPTSSDSQDKPMPIREQRDRQRLQTPFMSDEALKVRLQVIAEQRAKSINMLNRERQLAENELKRRERRVRAGE